MSLFSRIKTGYVELFNILRASRINILKEVEDGYS